MKNKRYSKLPTKYTFRILLKICALMVGAALLYFVVILLAFLMATISAPPGPAAPPKIRYGEFPFTLEYQIYGESKTIQDTIICVFDEKAYKKNKSWIYWNVTLKSGNEYITLFDMGPDGITDKRGRLFHELFFNYGNAYYYMDDEQNLLKNPPQGLNEAWCLIYKEDGSRDTFMISADEAYELCGLKLISWECAPPIRNSFEPEARFDWKKIVPILLVILFVAFVSKNKFKSKS